MWIALWEVHLRKIMKNILKAAAILALAGVSHQVSALDITIGDRVSAASNTFNTGPVGAGSEDNETEAGTISNQTWDLERFDLTGGILSLVGGFDMKSSIGYQNSGAALVPFPMGDIFVRIGKPVFDSYNTTTDTMIDAAYDYIIRFTSFPAAGDGAVGYTIYDSTASAILTGPPPAGTVHPNIYHKYRSGGNVIASGSGTYDDNSASPLVSGLLGDTFAGTTDEHDVISIDISSIVGVGNLYFMTTMDCGNDVIQGHQVPDSGLTLALFGLGIASVGLIRRRA